jgi:hypothetical protein
MAVTCFTEIIECNIPLTYISVNFLCADENKLQDSFVQLNSILKEIKLSGRVCV